MKWTVVTGNPMIGFELYGIFDSMQEADQWAALRFPTIHYSVMYINPTKYQKPKYALDESVCEDCP